VALAGSNLADRRGASYGYAYGAQCAGREVYPYAGRSWRLSATRSF
jgi:hypothetical protein